MSEYGFELGYVTPEEWGDAAIARPLELLNDHAHCELQAAVACTALIARYPDRPKMVDLATRVIAEEMVHFRRVVALLREMGGELGDTGPNPYVTGMRKGISGSCQSGILDRLLMASLIERRSCERFEMLARANGDQRLVQLYAELVPEEVEHQNLFVDAARFECGRGQTELDVDSRLEYLIQKEAELVPQIPFAPRMHSGPLARS